MCTPDPFAGVPGPVRAALMRRGFQSLTAVQQAVIAADADGRDLRISSKTGSGKTVAIGLTLAKTLLDRGDDRPDHDSLRREGPQALVIVPTRELAVQVRDELQWVLADIPAATVEVVTGGTDIVAERRRLARHPAILVGTPGRLLDHIRGGALRCDVVADVVLDEADRMLDMGFSDELDAIVESLPPQRRSHLVSATFCPVMRQISDRFQADGVLHVEGTALGEANADIDHVAHLVQAGDRYAALVNALLLAQGQRVLVFVERRDSATFLAEDLASDGFPALPFSGELSQAQRTKTLHAFRTGTIPILVSTDVAARGIDVPDISLVVHMAPPADADGYTHRSGRTGRAGRRGRSLLLVPFRAQRHVTRLLSQARVDVDWQPVPTPEKIRKAITKRTRKRLHTRLADGAGPSPTALQYAQRLLDSHDPATVIAALLEQAEPELPREPMTVAALAGPAPLAAARPETATADHPRRAPGRGRPPSRRPGRARSARPAAT